VTEAKPSLSEWTAAARPKTLAASVVPVAVGCAAAARAAAFDPLPAALCLLFAMLAQVGTNWANDYYDFRRGADREDRLGPARMVASGRIAPEAMRRAALGVFALAFLCGLPLAFIRDLWMLALGVLCLGFGYAYTGGPYPLAYRGLGDVFVIVFFGLAATGGAQYAVAGTVAPQTLAAGLAIGLLANNILAVNNCRDRETDARAGKLTLAARFGRRFCVGQVWTQSALALAVAAGLGLAEREVWLALPLLSAPLAARLGLELRWRDGSDLNPSLGQAALLLLAYGILFVAGTLLAPA